MDSLPVFHSREWTGSLGRRQESAALARLELTLSRSEGRRGRAEPDRMGETHSGA
jgi:hypothetical protein